MSVQTDAAKLNSLDRVSRIDVEATRPDGSILKIGMIQEISPDESRDVVSHYVLNASDDPAVLVPGLVTGRKLTIKGLALFGNTLLQQFGVKTAGEFITSLSQQTLPFDIRVTKRSRDPITAAETFYTMTYEGCYFSNFSYSQDIAKGGDITIVESCTAVYTRIVPGTKP